MPETKTAAKIRLYGPGDDAVQVSIYNEAAAALPRFKPATLDEVRRRSRDPSCDPAARFVAVVEGRPLGYATYQTNGRVSFPWCRKGHEDLADPLFARVLESMKERGLPRAFAAYRADWTEQQRFFARHGFELRCEMVGFVLDFADMPTPSAKPASGIGPLRPEDVPAVLQLGAGVLRVRDAAELERYLFHNPYFPPEALFALRSRAGGAPLAVGLVVANPAYANPTQTDAAMPCFRLGAFGTEGLTTKRINGMFSFLAAAGRDLNPLGLDLLGYASLRLQDTDVETFGAQVPSDAAHLLRFYTQYFRRQGSFPVLERTL
jgi:hypothetical protein